jgi:hypothetical protein
VKNACAAAILRVTANFDHLARSIFLTKKATQRLLKVQRKLQKTRVVEKQLSRNISRDNLMRFQAVKYCLDFWRANDHLLWEQEVGGSCAYGAFKSPTTRTVGKSRPDQPSHLNGVKNEGCLGIARRAKSEAESEAGLNTLPS